MLIKRNKENWYRCKKYGEKDSSCTFYIFPYFGKSESKIKKLLRVGFCAADMFTVFDECNDNGQQSMIYL
jgi:hypothetical protein